MRPSPRSHNSLVTILTLAVVACGCVAIIVFAANQLWGAWRTGEILTFEATHMFSMVTQSTPILFHRALFRWCLVVLASSLGLVAAIARMREAMQGPS